MKKNKTLKHDKVKWMICPEHSLCDNKDCKAIKKHKYNPSCCDKPTFKTCLTCSPCGSKK